MLLYVGVQLNPITKLLSDFLKPLLHTLVSRKSRRQNNKTFCFTSAFLGALFEFLFFFLATCSLNSHHFPIWLYLIPCSLSIHNYLYISVTACQLLRLIFIQRISLLSDTSSGPSVPRHICLLFWLSQSTCLSLRTQTDALCSGSKLMTHSKTCMSHRCLPGSLQVSHLW